MPWSGLDVLLTWFVHESGVPAASVVRPVWTAALPAWPAVLSAWPAASSARWQCVLRLSVQHVRALVAHSSEVLFVRLTTLDEDLQEEFTQELLNQEVLDREELEKSLMETKNV